MTVCIGAISPGHEAIVAVSDMMLSDDYLSADDVAVKFAQIFKSGRWWCMYSGSPTDFEELQRRLATIATPRTLEGAISAVERAYDGLTKHHIERQILAPFGLTHGKFIKNGVAIFGETYFRELSERCSRITSGTDLLVMGFDSKNKPHIFEAWRTGTCTVYDQLRFHAIGIGAGAALGSLYAQRDQDLRRSMNLSHIVYRLCEAKFVSEVARSVGPEITVITVFFSDGYGTLSFVRENDPVRKAWIEQRNLPIPNEAIEQIINNHRERMTRPPQFGRKRKEDPARSKAS